MGMVTVYTDSHNEALQVRAMKQVVLRVAGLWGPNEAAALKRELMRVPGVARAEVDLVSGQAVVH